MITVEYNGIKIQNALTREWRQEVVYDPSGTDQLLNRHTITFEGIVTEWPNKPPGLMSKHVEHARISTGWELVRIALSQPRHTLLVTLTWWEKVNQNVVPITHTFFQCYPESLHPENEDRDVSNGPKPQETRLLAVLGSHALKVSWTVQCEKLDIFYTSTHHGKALHLGEDKFGAWEITQQLAHSPLVEAVLNNRWSLREEFDENAFCVRTIAGSLRLSKNAARLRDDGRRLVTPPLETGFKRERMLYTIDPDGLTVHYEITDRQVHTAAPWPATKIQVRHRRSTADGVRFTAACQVRLEGPPFAPKSALLARTVQIMDFYTQFLTNAKNYGRSYYITQADLVEEIGQENAVEGHIELAVLGDPNNSQSFSLDFLEQQWLQLGKDLDLSREPEPPTGIRGPGFYNPHISWEPSAYGYTTGGQRGVQELALWWLIQCYLQRPHCPPHGIGVAINAPQVQDREPIKQFPVHLDNRVRQVDWLPRQDKSQEEAPYSKEHQQCLYTFVRMYNIFRNRKLRVGCPKTKKATSPGEKPGQNYSQSTVAILQLAEEIMDHSIIYDAERVGDWPELPYPQDEIPGTDPNSAKHYLVSYEVQPFPPTKGPTGRELIFRVRAKYRYLIDRPLRLDTVWSIGYPPHIELDRKKLPGRGFDATKFTKKLSLAEQ